MPYFVYLEKDQGADWKLVGVQTGCNKMKQQACMTQSKERGKSSNNGAETRNLNINNM